MRLLILLLISTAALAQEAPLRILRHDITIEIDPGKGTFRSVDRMKVEGTRIPKYHTPDGSVTEESEPANGAWTVTISGKLDNPVEKSGDATWVAGDRTSGTISPKGSYLARGFYVDGKEPCRYRVTIKVPAPHRGVTVGKLVSEKDGEAVFETGYPVDGVVVVTGPWVVEEREIDGVKCRTYLYEQDKQHSKLILDSLAVEIPRYQKIFGAVPDKRFDVVENFFATGYGFSNFTLLGDSVIRYVSRKARGIWPAGYLDHELVHCWLGNYLHVDYERGNWCEALTTYFTNYGAAEREKRDAEYRRKVSRTFSLRVGPKNDYPLRTFKAKQHDFENDIGYGKGSMVFHMLAREIGRDKLEAGIRKVIASHGGRQLGWEDLAKALDAEAWFKPWLDRKGAPVLELGACKAQGNRIVGTVKQAQDGAAYALKVPLRVTTADGVEDHVVKCASKESLFVITTKAAPQKIELDPDHHVFRRVPREHVEPCLQGVLTAPKKVGFGHEKLLARVRVPAVEPSLPRDAAVFAIGLGEGKVRAALIAGARRQEPSFLVHEKSFELFGKTYDQPGDSILLTFARPLAPGLPVTLFHGNSEAAFARATYLPYYASHGWVVFRNGRPIARGEFQGDKRARATVREGKPDGIVSDLLLLTDPAHGGRKAGSPASYKLANTLRGRMFQTGAKVLAWPGVAIPFGTCSEERSIIVIDEKMTKYARAFWPFHESASPQRPTVFERVVRHPTDKVSGSLVILPEDAPYKLAKKYADKDAAAVAVENLTRKRDEEAAWDDRVSAKISRSLDPVLPIPYLLLSGGIAKKLLAPDTGGVIRFQLKRTEISTHNIVGVIGEGKVPGVLLSAHWDGVGRIKGQIAPGAADNATGVAIVLWVAEQLEQQSARLKRPVVVALFGGEEQGLWGSRQFAKAMLAPNAPIAKPTAMVNVDGIGSGKPGQLYLIGRSHYPELVKTCERALKGTGLTLGRDIDRFAYPYGSDHWPLHKAGVPAVSLFSADYRAMNSLRDRLENVDIGHVRTTARVVLRMVLELASR